MTPLRDRKWNAPPIRGRLAGPGFHRARSRRRALIGLGLLTLLGLVSGCAATPLPLPPPAVPAGEDARPLGEMAYLAELIAQAREQSLWQEPVWHRLLHYMPNLVLPGVTSEADGPGFFHASDGKTNPQAELEATLTSFFSPAIHLPGEMTAQCTFPARYQWLKTRLGFDGNRLREQYCERFENWRMALEPESISLVFSSFYFNNPASIFGHTLLVANKRDRPESDWLLNYALNFSAVVAPDENDVLYALRGLFGGYQGYFAILPYYAKVREYNDMESRDMWEYRLRLPEEGLERMVRHTWELGSTYFDYYFLTENCSYHLLSLLEVAQPSLRLREQFHLWALPTETVRATLESAEILEKVIYRPARETLLEHKLKVMAAEEQHWVKRLIDDVQAVHETRFGDFSPPRQALILDAALDHYQGQIFTAKKEDDLPPVRKSMRTLLIARARLRIPSPPLPEQPRPHRPDLGHETSLVRLYGGTSDRQQDFTDLLVQPSYHDLASPAPGFADGSQINLGTVQMRYDREPDRWRLEKALVLDLISLARINPMETPLSWQVATGWQRPRDGSCPDCVPFVLNTGVGLTLASEVMTRERYYALLVAEVQADGDFERGHRSGAGATLGLLLDPLPPWRIILQGEAMRFGAGQLGTRHTYRARTRLALGRNGELLLEWKQVDGLLDQERVATHRETALGLGWYF